jgi:hypothetical protein
MKVMRTGSMLDVDNMEVQGCEVSGYAPQSALWLLVGWIHEVV